MILYNFISYTSGYPQQCQQITTQECQKIMILAEFIENCRIYEVSKKVVEKCCRNQSKNVVETSRNLSKFVEICRNVEKCCRNKSKNIVDMSKMCFLIFPTP